MHFRLPRELRPGFRIDKGILNLYTAFPKSCTSTIEVTRAGRLQIHSAWLSPMVVVCCLHQFILSAGFQTCQTTGIRRARCLSGVHQVLINLNVLWPKEIFEEIIVMPPISLERGSERRCGAAEKHLPEIECSRGKIVTIYFTVLQKTDQCT